jgi:hypothetical protein
VASANVEGDPDQETVPVYPVPAVVVVTGVAPLTGFVTPATAATEIVVAVAGNTAVITPESAEWVTEVAPATVKKLAVTPVNVYPDVGVRVIVAV